MSKEPEGGNEWEGSVSADGSDELYERLNLRVDKGQDALRIDKFLVQRIEGASRNKIQKALGAGLVLVNNRQVSPNYKIRPLDEIIMYSDKEAHGEEIVPEEMPLNIEYEELYAAIEQEARTCGTEGSMGSAALSEETTTLIAAANRIAHGDRRRYIEPRDLMAALVLIPGPIPD